MMTGNESPSYDKLPMTRYSAGLQRVVMNLLKPDSRRKITKVLPRTKLVMEYYREWKNGTEEGKNYKDIEDDLLPRYEAEMEMEM